MAGETKIACDRAVDRGSASRRRASGHNVRDAVRERPSSFVEYSLMNTQARSWHMPIEGPLRELGIHDVFQLLDLSRKTGALTVTSALRDNQGHVFFDRGAVIFATFGVIHGRWELCTFRAGRVTERIIARALRSDTRGERARDR